MQNLVSTDLVLDLKVSTPSTITPSSHGPVCLHKELNFDR